MASGWIKLHRKTLTSAVGRDATLLGVWVSLLLDAQWEDAQLPSGRILRRGQLLIKSGEYARSLGIGRQVFRRCLAELVTCGNVTSKPTSNRTLLTIVNYDRYQEVAELRQPAPQPAANQQPTSNQPAHSITKKGRRRESAALSSSNSLADAPSSQAAGATAGDQPQVDKEPNPLDNGDTCSELFRKLGGRTC